MPLPSWERGSAERHIKQRAHGHRLTPVGISAHMSRHISLGRSRQCVQSARAIVQSARAVVRAAEADKCGSIPCVAGRVWQPDAGVSVADAGREMQAGGGARACRGRSRSTKAHRERRAREARTPSLTCSILSILSDCVAICATPSFGGWGARQPCARRSPGRGARRPGRRFSRAPPARPPSSPPASRWERRRRGASPFFS